MLDHFAKNDIPRVKLIDILELSAGVRAFIDSIETKCNIEPITQALEHFTHHIQDNSWIMEQVAHTLPNNFKLAFERWPEIADTISNSDLDLDDLIRQADFSSITLEEDGFCIKGKPLSTERLSTELDSGIDAIKNYRTSKLVEQNKPKKDYGTIALVLTVVTFIFTLYHSMFPDVMPRVGESISQKASIARATAEFHVVAMVDRTSFRITPKRDSTELAKLPYGTKLRVSSEQRYWYQVEYITSDGVSLIGWVSKRSVER